jgi:predicted transposase/invertase (TIGR01784 family)
MTEKEFKIPELLPPSEDGVFKSLLTHPDAKLILQDVIASILQIPVADVWVRNTELPISGIGEKRERFDVNCVLDGDKQADVEMQSEAMKGDNAATSHANIKNRAIYYVCDLHTSQEGRSVGYGKLMRSYQITFCGYTVFAETEGFISRFAFRDEDGAMLSDTVGIVFVELPKLDAAMKKPVKDMTHAEMWGIFFGHADEPECRELLDNISLRKGEIKMAGELLADISRDEIERAHYRSRKMFRMDMEHDRVVTFVEGRAEGKAEGKAENMTEVAKTALAMGLQIGQIEKLTGLSSEEIKSLRAGD